MMMIIIIIAIRSSVWPIDMYFDLTKAFDTIDHAYFIVQIEYLWCA